MNLLRTCSLFICSLFFLLPAIAQESRKEVNYAIPGEYTIGGITVTGTLHLDPEILVSLSGLRVGDKIDIPGDAISLSIKSLWQQGLFTDIEVYITKTIGSTVFLEVSLKEKARLSRFTLKGIKKGEADDIREKINLIKGRVVNDNTKMTTANTIKNFYREKGFLNASVTIREIPDTLLANSIFLEIEIHKGNKVKIGSIRIDGNEIVADKKVKKLMKETREKVKFDIKALLNKENIKEAIPDSVSVFDWLTNIAPSNIYQYITDKSNLNFFKGSKFIAKEFRNDKLKIIDYYNEKGYRDAQVVFDTVYMKGKHLQIDMKISEGRQYYFRNITWKGNNKYSDEFLDKILNIEKGEIFNQLLLDERLFMSQSGNDISSIYMDDGYLFFQVTPVEVNVENDSIDMEIRIYEGPQATINEIRIYGNTKTKEYVIRRELRTLPGSKFSRADLIRSQREIIALNYFNPEELQVIPIPDPARGTVDIEYHVSEKPSDQLELSAGWGGRGRGVVGSLGVVFTNFSIQNMFKRGTWTPLPSGDGQRLSLRVQTNGKIFQSYNFSFTEPWLGGKKPNSFSVSYYHTRFSDLNFQTRQVMGKQITNGATMGIGTRLKWPDDFFTFQASLIYERFNLVNWASSIFILQNGTSNNLSTQFVLARNTVYDQIFPRSGSTFSLTLRITPPYSLIRGGRFSSDSPVVLEDEDKYKWIEYHKWRFNAQWFATIIGNEKSKHPLVMRFAAKFGFLGLYNDKIGYSPFERFELGGDGISNIQFFGRDIIALRGYEVISPRQGAPFFNKFTLEMRFPFSTNPSATIYALAFLEGGNYWNNIKEYNPFDLRRSAGIGVRIFLPMFGMLGFDYGIGFDQDLGSASSFGNYLSRYGRFSIVLGFEPE